ncbi:hypothetical protein P3X46_015459 [Hevea brasiliensis]|uniref:Protein PHYTOCHROME KINASE SUBSTRATE 1-like n=1 Tax=Hevea brasiliensis TaxID=3981 RepID=A0ABQ9LW21_HEVBR|nr:protein PHYTOCHROME KINASE SUBSTRATE 1 [Hevea brasiliensis]KAJ9172192.1 hypothetical protein P3X46_015459 [Hevea brasiliensis]
MAMATLTSVASLTQALPLENSSKNLLDFSFSSLLSNSDETFVRKLAESNRNIGAQDVKEHHYLGKKKEDGEIGIFGAEKYFNGCIDEDSPRISSIIPRKYNLQPKKDEQLNDHMVPVKPKGHPATPSVRSESSWDSQSALLQCVQRNTSETKKDKVHRKVGKNFLAGLGCKCSCFHKDSIDGDDEHIGEISFKKSPNAAVLEGKTITEELSKSSLDLDHKPRSGSRVKEENINCQNLEKWGIGMNKENCFSFPTSNSEAGSVPNKLQLRQEEEVNPRKSLEVFGSPVHDKRSKSFRIGRRLSMFSWEAAPRMEEIDYSATSGGVYNDNESDASSDLFEIESHTGKFTPFLARQGSNATSGCLTPTTCYAPSEASIEWSVVTASAADFSVMSDYEELRPPTTLPSPIKTIPTTVNAKSETSKDTPGRRSSILLGCNSHKAVRVAGDAYKTNDKASFDPRLRRVSDSYTPVTRFQSETKLMGFDPRQRQQAFSTHLHPWSHPSQSFHPYIQ